MEPSEDAISWGKRQAEQAPTWTEEKWQRIAAILGMTIDDDAADVPQNGPWSDAA